MSTKNKQTPSATDLMEGQSQEVINVAELPEVTQQPKVITGEMIVHASQKEDFEFSPSTASEFLKLEEGEKFTGIFCGFETIEGKNAPQEAAILQNEEGKAVFVTHTIPVKELTKLAESGKIEPGKSAIRITNKGIRPGKEYYDYFVGYVTLS